MIEITDKQTITIFHEFLNEKRNIKQHNNTNTNTNNNNTSTNSKHSSSLSSNEPYKIFCLPTPVPLDDTLLTNNLQKYDYMFYCKHNNPESCSIPAIVSFYINPVTCQKTIMIYLKNGMYYELNVDDYPFIVEEEEQVSIKEPDVIYTLGTIFSCTYYFDTYECIFNDVVVFKGIPCYLESFYTRLDYLCTFFEYYYTPSSYKNGVLVEFKKETFYNYKDFCFHIQQNDENNNNNTILTSHSSFIFIPCSLPLGINIQRTFFFYNKEHYFNLYVSITENDISLYSVHNENKEQLVLFASVQRTTPEGLDFYEKYCSIVQSNTIVFNSPPFLMNILYLPETQTFLPQPIPNSLQFMKYKECLNLRFLELLFVTIKKNITLNNIFSLY